MENVSKIKPPVDLRKALSSPVVQSAWNNLTPIAQRDFITWVEGAKQSDTRARRIEKAYSMLLAGKRRPCCYAVVPMNLYKALGDTPKAKATWKTLTPTERRDFVSWIDEAKGKEMHGIRIDKACIMLAAGKRHP